MPHTVHLQHNINITILTPDFESIRICNSETHKEGPSCKDYCVKTQASKKKKCFYPLLKKKSRAYIGLNLSRVRNFILLERELKPFKLL